MIFPFNGWVLLDKVKNNEQIIKSYYFSFFDFKEFSKFVKKRVSFDVKYLKKFEYIIQKNKNTVKFIEEVASTNEEIFKRTQLRQIKRIFLQQQNNAIQSMKSQPSRFFCVEDVQNFIINSIEKWHGSCDFSTELDQLLKDGILDLD